MRLQLALNVPDLERAIAFYSKMFGADVAKRKPGYANFSLSEPPLKLVLFEVPGAPERLNHLGVEVFDDAQVEAARERIADAELPLKIENETTCCYAKQNKVWTHAPDDTRWEWYQVLEDVS